jgi:3-methyl-2-oxobutanoate hydroxymethyltransferase
MTRLLDEVGIPFILVGDSLGMVVLGFPDTTHVTMADMEHHVRAAARAKPRALLVADMPFRSYETVPSAVDNAKRLIAAGADAVKAEGGRGSFRTGTRNPRGGNSLLWPFGMLLQHALRKAATASKAKSEPEHQACWPTRDAPSPPVRLSWCSNSSPPVAKEISGAFPFRPSGRCRPDW